MMLCVNCPKKPMAFLRVWGCILMLVIAVILSFQPLITLQLGSSGTVSQMKDLVNSFDLDEAEDFQGDVNKLIGNMPEEVEIGAMDIVSCIGLGVELVSALSSEDEAAFDDLAAMFESEEGQKTLMVTLAIAAALTEPFDIKGVAQTLVKDAIKESIGGEIDNLRQDYSEKVGDSISEEEFLARIENEGLESILDEYGINAEDYGVDVKLVEEAIVEAKQEEQQEANQSDLSENIFMMLLKIFVVMIALFAVLGMTVFAPVIYIVSALVALIPALIHVTDPDRSAAKVSKKLTGLITIPIGLMFYQCVLPTMKYASGTVALLAISLVCVFFNVILSRLHSYTEPQMKYANVMQLVSVVGVVGYIIFFGNVVKAGVFNTFMNGHLPQQLLNASTAAVKDIPIGSNGYIIDIAMIVITVILVLNSSEYLKCCLQRLSCSIPVGKKGSKMKDIFLVRAIFMLPIYVLPTIVASSNNYFKDITRSGEGDASLLILSDASKEALDGVLAGIVIILVAEILLIVLKATLCRDVSRQDMGDVMCGAACAETAAEDAPAVDAPAEDAPAEDAPAEDAPAEENAPETENSEA